MSGSKHFDRIAWIVTAITLVITVLFMNGAASEEYYTANVVIDGSEMSDDFDPSDMHGGFSGNFPAQPSGGGNANAPSGDAESNGENGENRPDGGNMQMPGGDFPFDMNGTNTPASNMTAWIWLAMSIIVLAIGLLIAKLYKH